MHDGMNRRSFLGWSAAAGAALLAPRLTNAQAATATKSEAKPAGEPETKPIKVTKLYDNLFLLEGSGGNMALQTGPDGNMLIDSSYTKDLARIREAIAALAPESDKRTPAFSSTLTCTATTPAPMKGCIQRVSQSLLIKIPGCDSQRRRS